MTTVSSPVDQGGLEAVSRVDRVPSLTGIRAVAALLVVATHAAYTTGKYTHGFVGLVYSRMEIGADLLRAVGPPAVRAVGQGGGDGTDGPSLKRYARNRFRRIMPAYVVTVLAAYVVYHFRDGGPNPGHTWWGLFRNLTLTPDLHRQLRIRASASGPDPDVEPRSGSGVLRGAAVPRLLPRGGGVPAALAPGSALAGLTGLSLISPAWLVLVHHRLPARRREALAAGLSGLVHRWHGAHGAGRDGRAGSTGSSRCRWR